MALELKSVNTRHDAIMMWLLSNPHRNVKECAVELNYGRAYVSQVIGTDVFQAKYQALCKEQGVEAAHAGQGIRDRLERVAHVSLSQLETQVERGGLSPKELVGACRMSLSGLGYGSPSAVAHTGPVTNVYVGNDVLQAARDRVLLRSSSTAVVTELPMIAAEVAA
jgi:hypothetical protein